MSSPPLGSLSAQQYSHIKRRPVALNVEYETPEISKFRYNRVTRYWIINQGTPFRAPSTRRRNRYHLFLIICFIGAEKWLRRVREGL